MKLKYLLILVFSLSLFSCEDTKLKTGNNYKPEDYLPTGVPVENNQGKYIDFYYAPYSVNDDKMKCYWYSKQFTSSLRRECEFICVSKSQEEIERIGNLLNSGRWLSDSQPFPLPFDISPDKLTLKTDLLNSIRENYTLTSILNIWNLGNEALREVFFGEAKMTDDAGGSSFPTFQLFEYHTSDMFGVGIKADAETVLVRDYVNSSNGRMCRDYVYTCTFTAPSNALASFLAEHIRGGLAKNCGDTTFEISGTTVTLTTAATYGGGGYWIDACPIEYIKYLDALIHQPLQAIVIQFCRL